MALLAKDLYSRVLHHASWNTFLALRLVNRSFWLTSNAMHYRWAARLRERRFISVALHPTRHTAIKCPPRVILIIKEGNNLTYIQRFNSKTNTLLEYERDNAFQEHVLNTWQQQ